MKKAVVRIFAATAMLTICTGLFAQTAKDARPEKFGGLLDNWFVGAGGGVTVLNEPDQGFANGLPAPMFEISVGKWFSPLFGVRFDAQGMTLRERLASPRAHIMDAERNVKMYYSYVHGDFLFNMMDMIGGYREDRWVNVMPYVNFGVMRTFYDFDGVNKFKREFAGGIGGLALFHINKNFDIYADLRASIVDGRIMHRNENGPAYVWGGSLGLNYNIAHGLWKPDGSPETIVLGNDMGDDWFVSLGSGMGALFELKHSPKPRVTPAFDISIGKWFSPSLAVRLGYQGGTMSCYYEDGYAPDVNINYGYTHGDILWNVLSTFMKQPHRFDIIPYGHLGVRSTYDRDSGDHIGLGWASGVGLIGSYRLDNQVSIFADGRMMIHKGGTVANKKGFAYATIGQIGLNYNFAFKKYNLEQAPIYKDYVERPVTPGSFAADWFLSVGAGVNMLTESGQALGFNGRCTPSVELAFGKWFSPHFGVRAGLQGMTLSEWTDDYRKAYTTSVREKDNAQQFNSNFQYMHLDLIARPIKYAMPYIHWGFMPDWTSAWKDSNFEMAGGIGIIGSLPISKRASAFIDLRESFLNGRSTHGNTHETAFLTTANLGLNYQFNHSDWEDPTFADYAGNFGKNIFITVGGGLNTIVEAGKKFNGHPGSNVEISIGKWFSPLFGARLAYQRGTFGEYARREIPEYTVNRDLRMGFGYSHADVLIKACEYAVPYIHMGFMDLNNYQGRGMGIEYAGGIGLLGKVPVGHGVSAMVDARATVMGGEATGRGGGANIMPSATFGLCYDFDASNGLQASPRDTSGRLMYNRMSDNWFVSVGGGATMLAEKDGIQGAFNGMVSPSISVSFGKWVHPNWGLRLGWQGVNINEKTDYARTGFELPYNGIVNANYSLLSADMLWRPIPWVAPYLRFGFLRDWNSEGKGIEYEYDGGLGVMLMCNFSDNVSGYLDLGTVITPSRAFRSNNCKYSTITTASLGLTYNIDKAVWHSAQGAPEGIYINGYQDNLFVTAGAGVITMFEPARYKYNGHITPTYEVMAGKWFSPLFGARLGMQGGRISLTRRKESAPRREADFQFGYIHGDVMCNLTNLCRAYKRNAMWDCVPYLHAGYFYKDLTAGLGVTTYFNPGRSIALYADLRSYIVNGSNIGSREGFVYGVSASIGASYQFGKHDFDRVEGTDNTRIRDKQFAVSTNITDYIDKGTINAEIQYAVHRHWTLDAQFRYNRQLREVINAGVKWWPWYHYAGFWMKGVAQVGTYEKWGLPWQDNQPDRTEAAGIGISVGYSLLINKWLNIDFGLGGWGGAKLNSKRKINGFFMPNELSISAMFVF